MPIPQRLSAFRSAFTCNESFLFWVILLLVLLNISCQSVDLNSLLSNFPWKICKAICTSTEKYLQTHKFIHMADLLGPTVNSPYTTDLLQMTLYNCPGVQLLQLGACPSYGSSCLLGLDPTGSATHFHTLGFMQSLDTRTGWTPQGAPDRCHSVWLG